MDDIMKAFLHGARRGSPTADWVEWIHVTRGKTHCAECLSLDNCWFMNANKPKLPQHPFCHCETRPISYKQVLDEATAKSITGKFDPFLFNTDGTRTHGKEKLFINDWGYSTADIPYMESEFERQALEKYIAGEYTLGNVINSDSESASGFRCPGGKERVMSHSFRDGLFFPTEKFVLQHHTEENNYERTGLY